MGLVLLARFLGLFQGLELRTLDLLLRLRPAEPTDPRILVVGIEEADIQQMGTYPVPDQVLADLLQTLDTYNPRVVGIGIYRDLPVLPGHEALMQTLAELPYVVGIEKVAPEPVLPPPVLPDERVGFADLLLDADSAARRVLLGTYTASEDYRFAFPVRLAATYLIAEDKTVRNGQQDPLAMQFGDTELPRLRPHTGGYVRADDTADTQMLLNFRSGSNPFRTVSLTQTMSGQVDPEWIRDAIVLVGLTSPSVKDFVNSAAVTSENPGQLYAVEFHAHATSQILSAVLDDRPLLRTWPDSLEYGWITLWGLLGLGIALRSRRLAWTLLGSALLLLLVIGTGVGLIQLAIWIPTLVPTIAFIAANVLTTSLCLSQTYQQQQITMRLLGQQASPEIAQALWDERHQLVQAGRLPPRSLTATILFSDIRAFTTLAEQQSPQQVMDWLNEYFFGMTDAVQQHQGVVIKFIGDGLMAVFGVPVPSTTAAAIAADAQRAVTSALAMERRLEQLNQSWKTQGLDPIQIRIGIFTGPVVVGSLGGQQRLEYGVIGDSVNTAARLESCEKHRQPTNCRILIAQATLSYLDSHFEVEPWGELPLRGKQASVSVYRVLGKASSVNHTP